MPPPERNPVSPILIAGSGVTLVENGVLIVGTGVTLLKNGISTVITSTGGSGGDTWRDTTAFLPVGTPNVDDDEFRDASIDASWTQVDATTATVSTAVWTEQGDAISLLLASGDSLGRVHAIMKPMGSLGIGTVIQTAVRFLSTGVGATRCGLLFADGITPGAGNEARLLMLTTATNKFSAVLERGTGYTTTTAITTITNLMVEGGPIHFRLTYTAADEFKGEWSPDGISWIEYITPIALTLTPTYMGIYGSSNASPTINTFEYFRVF